MLLCAVGQTCKVTELQHGSVYWNFALCWPKKQDDKSIFQEIWFLIKQVVCVSVREVLQDSDALDGHFSHTMP